MDKRLKRWEIALMMGLMIAVLTGAWLGEEQTALADKVIRLHVVANSDSGADPEFAWNTALEKSVDFGVLSSGERAMLEQGDFLRAQMVYVSYFALNAPARGGGVLLDRVLSGGGLTAEQARAVMERVDVPRM